MDKDPLLGIRKYYTINYPRSLDMNFNRDILRQFFNLTAILAVFGTNVLANIVPINGLTIGEISNTLFQDVLITPANYAFAIWGLIYLGLISLAIYQALPSQRQNPDLRRMGYLLAVSSVAQIVWVFFFQYRWFTLSVVAMLAILLPLIGIYLRLKIALKPTSLKQKWLVHIPISIYFAWICVATIVNVAIALYHVSWNGWGISPSVWTIIMLLVATILAIVISLQRADVAYVGVLIWALVAIAIRHLETPLLAGTSGGLALTIFLLLVVKIKIKSMSYDR